MRKLLQRWGELEPGRCEDLYGQTIRLHLSDDTNRGIHPIVDDLPIEDLALIQWAVQEAITERNWMLELEYYSGNDGWRATIKPGPKWTTGGSSNAAEALLSAYLKALESEVKSDG